MVPAAQTQRIGVAVISVGAGRDTNDENGQLIGDLLEENGHAVVRRLKIKDAPLMIKGELAILTESSSCQAIIMSGGTEISPRDTTYDALYKLMEKRLEGFGEIFRFLSYQENGPEAVLTRAAAGLYRGRLIIAIPAALDAVRLAMDKLILPQLERMVLQTVRRA